MFASFTNVLESTAKTLTEHLRNLSDTALGVVDKVHAIIGVDFEPQLDLLDVQSPASQIEQPTQRLLDGLTASEIAAVDVMLRVFFSIPNDVLPPKIADAILDKMVEGVEQCLNADVELVQHSISNAIIAMNGSGAVDAASKASSDGVSGMNKNLNRWLNYSN